MASVLSTVLMVGVLAVVTRLGAPVVDPRGQEPPGVALEAEVVEAWAGLLREDLSHASQIEMLKNNELMIVGYGALNAQVRERTHRPVRVFYKTELIGGRWWLVRRQAALDVLTNQNIQRDLVCSGVRRFELIQEMKSLKSETDGIFKADVVTTGYPKMDEEDATDGLPRESRTTATESVDGEDEGDREKSVVVWRLRVWPDDQGGPAYDRVVAMRVNGGA